MNKKIGMMQPQAKIHCSHQNLEEARKDSSLESPEGLKSSQHLDLRLLTS